MMKAVKILQMYIMETTCADIRKEKKCHCYFKNQGDDAIIIKRYTVIRGL